MQLEALDRPSNHAIKCFRDWLILLNTEEKEFMPEAELRTWYEPPGLKDLLAVQADRSLRDPFDEKVSHWFIDAVDFVKVRYKNWRKRGNNGVGDPNLSPSKPIARDKELRVYTKLRWVGMATAFLAALTGALIPIISILALYHIKGTPKRIYALIGFTVVFALVVKGVLRARTVDVFAMTAA